MRIVDTAGAYLDFGDSGNFKYAAFAWRGLDHPRLR